MLNPRYIRTNGSRILFLRFRPNGSQTAVSQKTLIRHKVLEIASCWYQLHGLMQRINAVLDVRPSMLLSPNGVSASGIQSQCHGRVLLLARTRWLELSARLRRIWPGLFSTRLRSSLKTYRKRPGGFGHCRARSHNFSFARVVHSGF